MIIFYKKKLPVITSFSCNPRGNEVTLARSRWRARILITSFFAIWSSFSLLVNADDHDLEGITLTNLMTPDQFNLSETSGEPLFMSFFEEKCRWCLKQIRAFNQLKSERAQASFVMVGVGENQRALRHWAKKAAPQIPVTHASQKLLELVGGVSVTPYTLIFDERGKYLTKVTGYLPKEKLELVLKKLNQNKIAST